MKRRLFRLGLALMALTMLIISVGCDSGGGSEGGRKTRTVCLLPEASGDSTVNQGNVTLDYSNTEEGYVMIKYDGDASKVKIQITGPDTTCYIYTAYPGDFRTFPLPAGSGNYNIQVLENVTGQMYALALSTDITADISDEFNPFLYPNQYVWFTEDSQAVARGKEISDKSADDLNYVENVYVYVTENIEYDQAKAASVETDYIPDIDETLSSGKGICFDFASLMAAMLRSQGIPSKLVVGYSGTAYHAWISVYLEETGWVDNVIEFDGKDWSFMDPTLASANDDDAVRDYVGDGTNYTVKYNY